jgi:hypothetical protein
MVGTSLRISRLETSRLIYHHSGREAIGVNNFSTQNSEVRLTAESWASLYEVSTIPASVSGTPFENYGRFKVGCEDAIDHYADRLLHPVQRVIEANESVRTWLLTAPPIAVLPAAANLLCVSVLRKLLSRMPEFDLTVRWLRKAPLRDLFMSDHYGNRDLVGRHRYLTQTSSGWIPDAQLRNASIIFINDVHVTGAQEERLRRYFMGCDVGFVHWQYLFVVNATNLQSAPPVEKRLNRIGLATESDFISLIDHPAITITSKFLWRLFSLSEVGFRQAVSRMPLARCTCVVQLLNDEAVPFEGTLRRKFEILKDKISMRTDVAPH